MTSILVFVPNTIQEMLPGYLVGIIREDSCQNKSIYIHDIITNDKSSKIVTNLVGSFSSKLGNHTKVEDSEQPNWIHVLCSNEGVSIKSCVISSNVIDVKDCLIIIYDINSLKKSELLVPLHHNSKQINHFKILANDLKVHNRTHDGVHFIVISQIINTIAILFSMINLILNKFSAVTQYSTVALHLKNYCQTILWIRNTYKDKGFLNLKVGNCLSSIIVDMLIGLFSYYLIMRWKTSDQIFDLITSGSEEVISSIRLIANWLMGSPAGLKLNQPLSSIFGSLVLYYLELWLSFLNRVRPILQFFFQVFFKLGFLGLTFQLAVCIDIFAVISFHVYCIYVYAVRLYEIQAKGIYSLSRLFLGRKRNPEPGKIDSCPYSTEELLVGTISFAVLLFLLPTTLIYYIVFAVMRLGTKIIRGAMTRTIYFMQILPGYITFVWFFFPEYAATSVKVTPCIRASKSNQGCLTADPAFSSWIDTIEKCKPAILSPPKPIKLTEVIRKIFVGKLM